MGLDQSILLWLIQLKKDQFTKKGSSSQTNLWMKTRKVDFVLHARLVNHKDWDKVCTILLVKAVGVVFE